MKFEDIKEIKMRWFKEFPKKEGIYWFYGYRFKGEEEKEFLFVKVRKISNGLMHVTEGQFMGESETGEGLFCKAEYPEVPNEEK